MNARFAKASLEVDVTINPKKEFFFLCALNCAAVVLAMILIYFAVLGSLFETHNQSTAKAVLLSYQDLIAQEIKAVSRQLDFVVKEPGFENRLQTDANNLKALFPYVKDVKVIPANKLPKAYDSKQNPLGFAALDMIKKVTLGQDPLPEVHRLPQGFAIHYVKGLKETQNDDLKAIVVLSQDLSYVKQIVSNLGDVPGFLQLAQTVEGQSQILAENGNKSLLHKTPDVSLPIGNSHLSLNLWLPRFQEDAMFAKILPLLFIGLSLCLLMSGTTFLLYRRSQYAVRKDVLRVTQAINKITKSTFQAPIDPNSHIFTLKLFKPIQWSLIEMQDSLTISKPKVSATQGKVPASIFRAYDIRGIVDEMLSEELVEDIGKSYGSTLLEKGQLEAVIARDGRLSSPRLSKALSKGIQSTGVNVIDIGEVPTPVLYFATHHLKNGTGIMITGSHNPKNYNGLKMMIQGHTLVKEDIQGLYHKTVAAKWKTGIGEYRQLDIMDNYLQAICKRINLKRNFKIVVDCGNGVAGKVVPTLLKKLGCDVIPLYCDVDGNFPNHHPDPSQPENLIEMIETVKREKADLGFAFDGDGDRLGLVCDQGEMIFADRVLIFFALSIIKKQPGASILFDVKCSQQVAKVIEKMGGKAVMCPTGHSIIKSKLRETNAPLAGEMSGHIFFNDDWFGFDDAAFAAARLLALLDNQATSSCSDIFAKIPKMVSTPEINVPFEDDEKFDFIESLKKAKAFEAFTCITIDGLRVEMEKGWGLVRASNTSPNLVCRFEGMDESALLEIQTLFKAAMHSVSPKLKLPF